MKTLVSRFTSVFAMIVACGAVTAANAQTPVATYQFNGNLAATQAGVSALTATDPQGTSGFGTTSVFGVNHGVYNFVGNTTPLQQAGLSLNTTGLLTQNNYSIEMVFKFTDRDGAWRRIIDVQNRQSDNGFYVDPGNHLYVFPVASSTTAYTNNLFHHVVLTNDGITAKGYLDGSLEVTAATTIMNISNSDNAGLGMNFFLDNVAGGGQGEYSSGSVALIRAYNTVLTDGQVATLAQKPFGIAVPEAGSLPLLALAVLPAVAMIARRRGAA